MKTIITIALLLCAAVTNAQTGLLMKRYYISGSLALGQDERGFADSAAWLQLGNDTTNKGIAFPKVLLDSLTTTQRALFVYDIEDSVLYHFDGAHKVRYMTYKDTALVKQLILDNAPDLEPYALKNDTAGYLATKSHVFNNYFTNGGNSYASTATIGTIDEHALALLVDNDTVLKAHPNGHIGIGATIDAGYTVDINGTVRSIGTIKTEGDIVCKNEEGIKILNESAGGSLISVLIGKNNGGYPGTGNRHIRLGFDNTGNDSRVWQYAIGQANNLGQAGNSTIAIGNFNAIATTESNQYVFGESNEFDYDWSATSRGQFIIGSSNVVNHKYSSVLGNYQQTTGANQLIIADGNPNSSNGGYRNVYFGSGPVSTLSNGVGAPVTINASGANGTDKQGGYLKLAAGKSTGAAAAPDIVLATTTADSSGTAQQVLINRWYIKGETGYLSNNSAPTSLLDIGSINGYAQLRLRNTYTPANTADSNGEAGTIAWDENYLYLKTATGWKRTQLSTF